MIEGKILRYRGGAVGGDPETIQLTVLEPDHVAADGRRCHFVSREFWRGAHPWARSLFERWGFEERPEEVSLDRLHPVTFYEVDEIWAEPEGWPTGMVELADATVTYRGKVATVVVAPTSRE